MNTDLITQNLDRGKWGRESSCKTIINYSYANKNLWRMEGKILLVFQVWVESHIRWKNRCWTLYKWRPINLIPQDFGLKYGVQLTCIVVLGPMWCSGNVSCWVPQRRWSGWNNFLLRRSMHRKNGWTHNIWGGDCWYFKCELSHISDGKVNVEHFIIQMTINLMS
jgi:hypothetical protein